ncbi:STAS domain-containing protein [Candidatus Desantisbacteria bacterium]|nr:STAS domain-containing protein [Candidatus Desantisbacteria bacterium]
MSSNISVLIENGIAKIDLNERLDASNAPAFQEEMKKIIGQNITSIVFNSQKLEYISSAGLRVIIFAKQKLGEDAKIYMIGAKDVVLNVLKMSGLDNFMILQDTF